MAETVTVNGITLEEGMTLWRLKGVSVLGGKKFSNQSPDEVLQETARQLAGNYPDAVDEASVEEVKENLRDQPGYYDDTDLMKYQAMEVEDVNPGRGQVPLSISIRDLKEGTTFSFKDRNSQPEDGYIVFETMDALRKHLGTTLLPVTDT